MLCLIYVYIHTIPERANAYTYIRQSTSACVITIICTYVMLPANLPNLTLCTYDRVSFVIVGLYFIIVMMFLHGSDGDCEFITTFYSWIICHRVTHSSSIMIIRYICSVSVWCMQYFVNIKELLASYVASDYSHINRLSTLFYCCTT